LTVLALAAHVYVATELAPIAATPAIASTLGVSEADVGMLTAAYAVITVIATLPLVRCTAHWPRRRVLICALACLVVSLVLSVAAVDLAFLAGSRVLCAVTHGLMWSIIVPIGSRLVPATHTGRATTAIYAGAAAAPIFATPLTAAVSQAWGWRPTAAAMALAALAVAVLARVVLPAMPVDAEAVPTRKPLPPRNKGLILLCGLTFVGVTAHFVSYTFIVPVLRDVVGVGAPRQSWILAGYGTIGLLTMAVLARALDKRVRLAAGCAAALLCVAFGCLTALSTGPGVQTAGLGVGLILVWGAGAGLLPPLLQSAAIRTSSDEPERGSAWYVTTFQFGIVAGSVAGGLVYAHSGISAVVLISALLFGVACVGVLLCGDAFAGVSVFQAPPEPLRDAPLREAHCALSASQRL